MKSLKWNRSSTLTPEQMGAVNTAIAAEMSEVMPEIINLGLPAEKVSEATKLIVAAVESATRQIVQKVQDQYSQ